MAVDVTIQKFFSKNNVATDIGTGAVSGGIGTGNQNLQQVTDIGNTTTNSILLYDSGGTNYVQMCTDANGNLIFSGTSGNTHFWSDVVAFSCLAPAGSWLDERIATDSQLGFVCIGDGLIIDGNGCLSVDGSFSGGTGSTTFLGLTDTPNSFSSDCYLKVNAGGTALEWTGNPAINKADCCDLTALNACKVNCSDYDSFCNEYGSYTATTNSELTALDNCKVDCTDFTTYTNNTDADINYISGVTDTKVDCTDHTLQKVTDCGNDTTNSIILKDAGGTKCVSMCTDANGNLVFSGTTGSSAHFWGDVVAFSCNAPPPSTWFDLIPVGSGLTNCDGCIIYTGLTGGDGTPSPPDCSIQFNNSGSFSGSSKFVYDINNNKLCNVGSSPTKYSSLNPYCLEIYEDTFSNCSILNSCFLCIASGNWKYGCLSFGCLLLYDNLNKFTHYLGTCFQCLKDGKSGHCSCSTPKCSHICYTGGCEICTTSRGSIIEESISVDSGVTTYFCSNLFEIFSTFLTPDNNYGYVSIDREHIGICKSCYDFGTTLIPKACFNIEPHQFTIYDGTNNCVWNNSNLGGIQSVNWGDIGGTLSNQTDLENCLNGIETNVSSNTSDITTLDSCKVDCTYFNTCIGNVNSCLGTKTDCTYFNTCIGNINSCLGTKADCSAVYWRTTGSVVNPKSTGCAVGIGTTSLNGTEKLRVNGCIYADNDIIAFSDIRGKYDVCSYNKGLDDLINLYPKYYKRKGENTENVGFIAQEVNEVEPVAVTKGNCWAIKQGKLEPLIVNSIKELYCCVGSLKKKNTSLQSQLTRLKNKK